MPRLEICNMKELPELQRMGHTCANLNGELFFIWGGSDESIAHRRSCDTHLWIYETLTGYWRHRSCSGECPPYLSGTTSVLIGQKMYVFGGHSTAHDNWLNGLYCLSLDTFVWKDLGSQAKAEPTEPIRADKCVSWSYNGRMYVFGGYGWSQVEHLLQLLDKQKDLQLTPDYRWPKFGWNNQLVEFDPADNTWRWPSYSGRCPSARAAHSGALMGSKYYLFGGRDCRERLNDLYVFDMDTFEWTQLTVFADMEHERLERPIMRHLLEPMNADENEPANQQNERSHRENSPVEVENLTASPSSSSHFHEAELMSSSSSSASSTSADDDDEEHDEDDDDDEHRQYPFDYPHPSHLLERWSLSSHQSASSSSNMADNINCLPQQSSYANFHDDSDNNPNHPVEMELQIAQHSRSEENSQPQPQQQQQQQQNQALMNPSDDDDDDQAQVVSLGRYQAPVPAGRSFSSFTPISDREILLYGGVNSEDKNLDDCWLFNIKSNRWTQMDLKTKQPRLWHTGSRTKNNEVVIIGGSSSDKIDEFCSDILVVSLEPKSLKRMALDAVARHVRMRSINKTRGQLPSTICKLIKLRKQAMALTMRRSNR